MILTHLITAFLAAKLATGYLVTPSGAPFPGADSDCSAWVEGTTGISCADVVAVAGITLTEFETWNPLVADGSTCELTSGYWYCIQVDFESTSSTSTTLSSTATSTGDGVSTPSPIQTGMVSTCEVFYLVIEGEDCETIASISLISLDEFYAWNPAVGSNCTNLVVGDYVCIDILGDVWTYTATATVTSTTSTTSGDGITTPTPIQTGMVSTCDEFYLVVTNDTCDSIATSAGISLDTFYSWNPAVGSSCADLELGDYVCVDIIGYTITSATATATTTTSGDGISTPSPIQTGMISTCDEFHLVVSGDECATIAADAGISLDTFYSWNPAVGSSCAYLGLGDYVCIDIIGYTITSAPASASATATTTGDGISTPSPVQTGMISTCNEFHLVVSGDECAVIAADAGISLATFYSWNPAVGSSCADLELGDYVCIDIIGYTPSTTTTSTSTTTTSTGNGVTTPTPYETGMVSDCDTFHLVVSGDTCTSIADSANITVADIEAWNADVGTDCTDIWLDYYICVGIL